MSSKEAGMVFRSAEKDSDRISALQKVSSEESNPKKNFALWEIMALLPSKNERSHMAFELRLPQSPDATWPLISGLLLDLEQDIVGNAINSLTFSQCRTLGHRLLPLYLANEKPQRVLYCLARYVEETIDRRFEKYIAPNLSFDISDAFLARSFNALFKLGIKDPHAIKVASELIQSHVHATNMDRKAAVSAILYLCFAGDIKIIEFLAEIRDKVSIPELRRLLNWGLAEAQSIGSNKFSGDDAVIFLQRALFHSEPNFSGYGCFATENLLTGLKKFLSLQDISNNYEINRCILALGNEFCVDLLANDKRFGIVANIAQKNELVLNLWKQYNPKNSKEFLKSVSDPENYAVWHSSNNELMAINFDSTNFTAQEHHKAWNSIWKNLLKTNKNIAAELLATKILILEKDILEKKLSAKQLQDHVSHIGKNITELITMEPTAENKNTENILVEKLYSVFINSTLPAEIINNFCTSLPMPTMTWITTALACSQNIKFSPQSYVDKLIHNLDIPLQDIDCSQEEYVQYVVAILLALVNISCNNQQLLTKSMLDQINFISHKIQTILDALAIPDDKEHQDGDEDVADWSGHISVDKPVLRWNAILQATLAAQISQEFKYDLETILREALRMAPHVDKRWIIRSLVKLGTDDAVKSILYQAFQHIDNDFVAHTIKELLPSKHPRAQQALIRCVGRTSVPDELKLNILEEITLENPEEILRELRALELLRLPPHIDDAIRDTVGRVATLIDTTSNPEINKANNSTSIIDVEHIISNFLPNSDKLSLDTKSALRTAEMILIQSNSWGTEAVDLSPIVNMHCKAVELALREILEPWTDSLMRQGMLSRKLDILGYARPIPEKMQIFEDYLAALPIIKTIPYFSRFKLRKMLRAICLYRPGKRFTLDGPKAFALLLLVTSRHQCSFGLANLFETGFKTDLELFEFIKLVHSLQDSRNRAVHEGLTWEAKDDIESMRSQAYKIIEQTLKIDDYIKQHQDSDSLNQPRAVNQGA